jgi:hypothetical protein
MGLKPVFADVALPLAAREAGTFTSGTVANAGAASEAVLFVYASASSGTPTLNASLEESNDGSSWSAVAGSAITQLTAAGNAMSNAQLTKQYVRVTSAVAGGTPSITYRALLQVIGG